jgi:penicillin-binding protein 2
MKYSKPDNLHFLSEQDALKQKRQFKNRLTIAFLFVVLCFGLLLGRMAYLQILNYQHYHAMAEGNRISAEVIPPVRGRIYDRNHVLLADNQPTYTLQFTREKGIDIDKLITTLKSIVPDLSPNGLDKFAKKMHRTRYYNHTLSPFNLTESQAAKIAVNSYRLPGLSLTARLKRTYPFTSTAVHALGYVGRINMDELQKLDEARYRGTDSIGKAGIEQYYEDTLHGYPGLQYIETNAKGRVIRKLEAIPAKPGKDVQLTLDIKLQQYAEKLLEGKKGAIVVMNPNNGEILAYVSQPTYDPNLFVDGISQKDYQVLLNNKQKPFINRVINGQYPPGSTIKPFVALGAIEHNIISPNKKIYDPGYLEFAGHRYRDWKRWGHGLVDMDKAISESCDTYFYELGLKMGIDMIHDTLYPFGFGHPTGVDLPRESSGILPSQAWKRNTKDKPWYRGETVIAAIGQGYMLATPLQLAKATSILANHGQVVRPHLKMDPLLEQPTEQIPIKDVRNWDRVIKSMTHVLHDIHGTAHRYAKGLPFKMAGKTGTAQVFSLKDAEYDADNIKKSLRDHSLFIGFAPVKHPQVAISVIVENSSVKAAPLAVDIARYYLTREKNFNLPQPNKVAQ